MCWPGTWMLPAGLAAALVRQHAEAAVRNADAGATLLAEAAVERDLHRHDGITQPSAATIDSTPSTTSDTYGKPSDGCSRAKTLKK